MGKEITEFGKIEMSVCGIRLDGIEITQDSISIRLNAANGPIIGVCDAYCCSETWIENIELPALGFPCTVISATNLEMPDGRDATDDEPQVYIQFYGLKLVTDKGDVVIEYRNASNGYYGGELVWDSEQYYGGAFGQQKPEQEWLTVEDWLNRKAIMIEHG